MKRISSQQLDLPSKSGFSLRISQDHTFHPSHAKIYVCKALGKYWNAYLSIPCAWLLAWNSWCPITSTLSNDLPTSLTIHTPWPWTTTHVYYFHLKSWITFLLSSKNKNYLFSNNNFHLLFWIFVPSVELPSPWGASEKSPCFFVIFHCQGTSSAKILFFVNLCMHQPSHAVH